MYQVFDKKLRNVKVVLQLLKFRVTLGVKEMRK